MRDHHDTPEAVEAMAATNSRAAAMLRRLHQRAVDAEQELERALRAMKEMAQYGKKIRTSLATARADALREAAEVVGRMTAHWPHVGPVPASVRGEWAARDKIKPAILALIPEKPHDR